VDGRVRNSGEKPIKQLMLVFDFMAPGKQVITTQKGAIDEELLAPGQEAVSNGAQRPAPLGRVPDQRLRRLRPRAACSQVRPIPHRIIRVPPFLQNFYNLLTTYLGLPLGSQLRGKHGDDSKHSVAARAYQDLIWK